MNEKYSNLKYKIDIDMSKIKISNKKQRKLLKENYTIEKIGCVVPILIKNIEGEGEK